MNLFSNYKSIQFDIDAICDANNFNSDEIELFADILSSQDKEILLNLLKKKLHLQEMIYIQWGGSLENIIFLSSYK